MYSDGLAAFSIYIEPAPGLAGQSEKSADTVSRNGATVAVAHSVAVAEADGEQTYRVTLVGEIPLATARAVLSSVQPK